MRLKSEDYMRKDRMWTYYNRIYNLTRSNGENATGPWWKKTMLAHAKCHLACNLRSNTILRIFVLQ
jgi:hypothetical protein